MVNITLIGRGMGDEGTFTIEAKNRIENADAVFGAARLIGDIQCDKKYEMYLGKDIIPVIKNDASIKNAAIVFSGDSGFYSGAQKMIEAMAELDAEVDIIPGVSSVSYLASKLGKPYSEASICSLHGRNDAVNINITIDNIMHSARTFILLSGAEDIRSIGERLVERELDANILMYIGINLSYEDERVLILSPKQATSFDEKGTMVCMIENNNHNKRLVYSALNDDEFIRDKVPMTKACVRHESILALNLCEGDVVYDIGGGTGSVAIEIAKQSPSIKVYTIEKNAEAIALIEQNKAKHHTDNLTIVEGEAPKALADLEACDAVFVGGSGGHLSAILTCIKAKKANVKVVINAVSLETVNELTTVLTQFEIADYKAMQLGVTEVKEIGPYHMMQANNPVMIYSFVLR